MSINTVTFVLVLIDRSHAPGVGDIYLVADLNQQATNPRRMDSGFKNHSMLLLAFKAVPQGTGVR